MQVTFCVCTMLGTILIVEEEVLNRSQHASDMNTKLYPLDYCERDATNPTREGTSVEWYEVFV